MTGVMEPAWTMPLASDDATLAQVGGKGASLAVWPLPVSRFRPDS